MTSFFNEIVHHVYDEIKTSLDEIKVCDFDEIKSVFISLRSKISSRSDFICEADLFRWKTVFSGGAGGISIASQSFLLDDRSLRSGARPRIISLKNSPPDYFLRKMPSQDSNPTYLCTKKDTSSGILFCGRTEWFRCHLIQVKSSQHLTIFRYYANSNNIALY